MPTKKKVKGQGDKHSFCIGVHDQKKLDTENLLNIRTPKKIVVITLKFELCGSTIE